MVTPFSTILSLSIMKLIHDRDLEMNTLRSDAGSLTTEELTTRFEQIDATTADAVLDTCQTTLAKLESVVDSVLQINEQMRLLRNA